MEKTKTINIGRDEIVVDNAIYNAYRRELERTKKQRQRLRKDEIDFEVKSLNEMFMQNEFEPADEFNLSETVVKDILRKQLWTITESALNFDEWFIISSYYREELTDTDIGSCLGISRQAVTKQRKKILRKLKHVLKGFECLY